MLNADSSKIHVSFHLLSASSDYSRMADAGYVTLISTLFISLKVVKIGWHLCSKGVFRRQLEGVDEVQALQETSQKCQPQRDCKRTMDSLNNRQEAQCKQRWEQIIRGSHCGTDLQLHTKLRCQTLYHFLQSNAC